jgi:hypothetical protein
MVCFKVTRHRHVSMDTKLVVDLRFRGNEWAVTLQQQQSVISLWSIRGLCSQIPEPTEQNSKKDFDRTSRSSSIVKGQFKGRSSSSLEKAVQVGVQEPSQPSRLVGPGRGVGPVGPRGIQGTASAKQKLLMKLIQVNYLCCWRNCFEWL